MRARRRDAGCELASVAFLWSRGTRWRGQIDHFCPARPANALDVIARQASRQQRPMCVGTVPLVPRNVIARSYRLFLPCTAGKRFRRHCGPGVAASAAKLASGPFLWSLGTRWHLQMDNLSAARQSIFAAVGRASRRRGRVHVRVACMSRASAYWHSSCPAEHDGTVRRTIFAMHGPRTHQTSLRTSVARNTIPLHDVRQTHARSVVLQRSRQRPDASLCLVLTEGRSSAARNSNTSRLLERRVLRKDGLCSLAKPAGPIERAFLAEMRLRETEFQKILLLFSLSWPNGREFFKNV